MYKAIAAIVLLVTLAGCDAFSALTDGMKQAGAVETNLAAATGVKPTVGFNWHNGKLTSVNVSFPGLYEDKPLRELAALTRAAVAKEFKQAPSTILLSFAVEPGTTAEAEIPHGAN